MLIFTARAVGNKLLYYNVKCRNQKISGCMYVCTYALFRFLDVRCASVID